MTCTTFLSDGELNQPLPDPECQHILECARKQTGRDWQVVPLTIHRRKWFRERTETLYGVYVFVGGVGPWQQINFFREGARSSINLYVPLEVVAAYFLGMLANQIPKNGGAIPEGWQLVPIKDTAQMWTAGGRAIKRCGGHERDAASLAYAAMLAAAPKKETP